MTFELSGRSTTVRTRLPLLVAQGQLAAWLSRYSVYRDGVTFELRLRSRLSLPPASTGAADSAFSEVAAGGPAVLVTVSWAQTRCQAEFTPVTAGFGRSRQAIRRAPAGERGVPAAAQLAVLAGSGDADSWQQELAVTPIPSTGDLEVTLAGVRGAARSAVLPGAFLREMAARLGAH